VFQYSAIKISVGTHIYTKYYDSVCSVSSEHVGHKGWGCWGGILWLERGGEFEFYDVRMVLLQRQCKTDFADNHYY